MGDCAVAGCEGDDTSACTACGQPVCSAHSAPESHDCPALSSAPEGRLRADGGGPSIGPRRRSGAGRGSGGGVASWISRVLGLAFWIALLAILLMGFTPMTVPAGVPSQVADPIEQAAGASSAFVANLTDESLESGTVPVTTGESPSETGDTQPTSSTYEAGTGGLDRERIEGLVHQNVNEERQSHGLSSLSVDGELREIARYHSKDMAETEYFAHTAPDGETMGDRYEKFGYQCRVSTGTNRYAAGGENIFMLSFSGTGYTEEEIAERTVQGWMDSPGHRENLLKEYWNTEGIGVYVVESDGKTRVYVTQNFC